MLAATTCLQHGVGKHTVVGPHARFQVRSGEIVNIGMFKMTQQHEHPVNLLNPFDKNPVISRRSIEPLSAQAIAYFKETIPYTFAKAVMRPMTLLGSPQSELKKPRTIFD